ncbi:MAG: hypothetical protein Q7R41_01815 [Phycisphaerales bacterium]|nr:hypothetical protein [Phycisphaerales bacterium]
MAIRRRIEDTGIYRHVDHIIGTVPSPCGERTIVADGEHIVARARRLQPLERKHWQQHAKRLALATIRSTTATLPVKRPAAFEAGHTAERLLRWLELMTKARNAGETDKALWYAFAVGRYYESLLVRPFEPSVLRENKAGAGRTSGRTTTRQAAERRARTWAILKAEIDGKDNGWSEAAKWQWVSDMAYEREMTGNDPAYEDVGTKPDDSPYKPEAIRKAVTKYLKKNRK